MAPITQTSSQLASAPLPPDLEPDDDWKRALKLNIEAGLLSMVDEARQKLNDELAKGTVGPDQCERLTADHLATLKTIRQLAEEQFRIALERERQERRWASGEQLDRAWSETVIKEQQAILDRIERMRKGSIPTTTARPIVQEFWKPSITPEEDAQMSRTFSLARRSSTASQTSSFKAPSVLSAALSDPLDPLPGPERERSSIHAAEQEWASMDRARGYPHADDRSVHPLSLSSVSPTSATYVRATGDRPSPSASRPIATKRSFTVEDAFPSSSPFRCASASSRAHDRDRDVGPDGRSWRRDYSDRRIQDIEDGLRKREEAANRREEELTRKAEELKREDEAMRKRVEEQRREVEVRRLEEEARQRDDDEAERKQAELRIKEDEADRKAREAAIMEEEVRRKEQEAKKKERDAQLKEEEAKRKEKEARSRELEARRKEEEVERKENEARRKEEEVRVMEEEARRTHFEARRKQQEAEQREEEARRRAEEATLRTEEMKRKEDELRRREEELRRKEEEAKKKERDGRLKEEEAKRKEKEARSREMEARQREWEAQAIQREQGAEDIAHSPTDVPEREESIRRKPSMAARTIVPEIWKPSITPEEDAFVARTFTPARRSSPSSRSSPLPPAPEISFPRSSASRPITTKPSLMTNDALSRKIMLARRSSVASTVSEGKAPSVISVALTDPLEALLDDSVSLHQALCFPIVEPDFLRTRAEARRLEDKVAAVTARKCSVEEVSALHHELQEWLTHNEKQDDQFSSLILSAALLRAILVNHFTHSEATKSLEATLKGKLDDTELTVTKLEAELKQQVNGPVAVDICIILTSTDSKPFIPKKYENASLSAQS